MNKLSKYFFIHIKKEKVKIRALYLPKIIPQELPILQHSCHQ